MAMKKDGEKGKKTLSGKKPATFGGPNPLGRRKMGEINYTDMSGKKRKITPDDSKGKSIMFAKGPAPKMNAEATGERNFDRSSSSRATVSVGPVTLNTRGKTAKSTGGMNMTGGKVLPKKSVNPTAKVSGLISKGPPKTTTTNNNPGTGLRKTNSVPIALGAGLATVGTGIVLAGGGKKIKQAVKYIADTKNRKARKRAQKAENDAFIVEREKKNPKATFKASKSTMKKLKAR